MPNPSAFGRYHARCRAIGRREHPKLNVFASHYRVASGVQVTSIDGLKDDTITSYNACLRVSLAWTALESLEKAVSGKKSVNLVNESLAHRMRLTGAPVFEALTNSHAVHRTEKRSLRAIQSAESDDLRSVAYAIRNAFFHGATTVSALKLPTSKSRRELVNDLADFVLNRVDARFTQYVNRMR